MMPVTNKETFKRMSGRSRIMTRPLEQAQSLVHPIKTGRLPTMTGENMTKRGRMSIRHKVWDCKFRQHFLMLFVKLQEEKAHKCKECIEARTGIRN